MQKGEFEKMHMTPSMPFWTSTLLIFCGYKSVGGQSQGFDHKTPETTPNVPF